MSNVVGIPKKINTDALQIVSSLIPRIESGEITGITLAIEFSDGTYTTMGSESFSRLQSAGVLLEMAIRRINNE
jgi:hypothetical protein